MTRTSVQTEIEQRIGSSQDLAFIPREFANLSGRRQVTRALAQIVADGMLVRVAPGLYGRAAVDPRTGKPALAGEFGDVANEAMLKMRTLAEEASRATKASAKTAGQPLPGG